MVAINTGVSGMLTLEEKKKRKAEYKKEYYQKNKEALAEYRKEYYQKNKERMKEVYAEYYQKNKELKKETSAEYRKNNKEAIAEYKKEYYQKNKERMKEVSAEYRKNNKEAIARYTRKWEEENKEAIAEYKKEYRKNKWRTNLDFKFQMILRNALYKNLKRYLIKETNPEFSYTKASSSLLGCTVEELKTYIENQFEDGMTWENWAYDGWHLDHIIPCSSFDLTKKKEQKKCFHYTNLQPLWAKDNMSKGSKLNWNKKELVV